jgi:hypothetical protein
MLTHATRDHHLQLLLVKFYQRSYAPSELSTKEMPPVALKVEGRYWVVRFIAPHRTVS